MFRREAAVAAARLIAVAGLSIDAYVHLDLASTYAEGQAPINEGILFRAGAVLALLTGLALITLARRLPFVLAWRQRVPRRHRQGRRGGERHALPALPDQGEADRSRIRPADQNPLRHGRRAVTSTRASGGTPRMATRHGRSHHREPRPGRSVHGWPRRRRATAGRGVAQRDIRCSPPAAGTSCLRESLRARRAGATERAVAGPDGNAVCSLPPSVYDRSS